MMSVLLATVPVSALVGVSAITTTGTVNLPFGDLR